MCLSIHCRSRHVSTPTLHCGKECDVTDSPSYLAAISYKLQTLHLVLVGSFPSLPRHFSYFSSSSFKLYNISYICDFRCSAFSVLLCLCIFSRTAFSNDLFFAAESLYICANLHLKPYASPRFLKFKCHRVRYKIRFESSSWSFRIGNLELYWKIPQ